MKIKWAAMIGAAWTGIAMLPAPAMAARLIVQLVCEQVCENRVLDTNNGTYAAGGALTATRFEGTNLPGFRWVGGSVTAIARQGALGVAAYTRNAFGVGVDDPFPIDARTSATGIAYWDDVLTINSATLAVGTSVYVTMTNQIFITEAYARTLIEAPPPRDGISRKLAEISAVFQTQWGGACFYAGTNNQARCDNQTRLTVIDPLHRLPNTLSFTRLLRVGDSIPIFSRFAANSFSFDTYLNGGDVEAGFTADGTAHSYFSIDDPAASLSFASGSLYVPTAVPEPASWALMIAGFGLVGSAIRRSARPWVKSCAAA